MKTPTDSGTLAASKKKKNKYLVYYEWNSIEEWNLVASKIFVGPMLFIFPSRDR